MQPQNKAHEQVENATEDLPVQGLALDLSFRAQPAGTDRDICALLQCVEKFCRFFNRRRQVSIAKDKNVSFGAQHPVADAVSLAMISGILD